MEKHKMTAADMKQTESLIGKVSRLVSGCTFNDQMYLYLDSEEWTDVLLALQWYKETGKVIE